MRRVIAVAVLFLCMGWGLAPMTVKAAAYEESDIYTLYKDQAKAVGADRLYDDLPEETQALLRSLGTAGIEPENLSSINSETVFQTLADLLAEKAPPPVIASIYLVGIIIFLAFASGFGDHLQIGSFSRIIEAIGATAMLLVLLYPVWETVDHVGQATESAAAFVFSFTPVYTALLIADGSTSSSMMTGTLLTAADSMMGLIRSIILPLLTISLAVTAAGATDSEGRLGRLGALISKAAAWILGTATALFTAMLTLQGLTSATTGLGGRAARLSLAAFVPVVGGSMAEAVGTVVGCMRALRGTVAAFGVVCTFLTILPTLIECVIWCVCLAFIGMVCELFSLPLISRILTAVQTALKCMIGALFSEGLLMIISLSLTTFAGVYGYQ
ncbi:MAG: hypothetical protein IJU16_03995 [Clostridia bacterium]|nr:hypothetical protein [Clostridia bacterium]